MNEESFTHQDLCAVCGLCCDGTLFTHANVDQEEARRLAGLGAELTDRHGATALRLGCSLYTGSCCPIYEDRPQTCRNFHCSLIADVRVGTMTFDEAVGIIEETKSFVAEVAVELGPTRHLREKVWEMSDDGHSLPPFARLSMAALGRVRVRHFVGRRTVEPDDLEPRAMET